jgi:hypothetical protein
VRKKNLRHLVQTTNPEDIDDLLDEEECHSTNTSVLLADTDGKTFDRTRKRNRQGRVRRAAAREQKYRAQER